MDTLTHSTQEEPRVIRFGIMCDGDSLEQWQLEAVEKLLALRNVELALLIVNETPPAAAPKPGMIARRLRLLRNPHLLYLLFCQFFYRPPSTEERSIDHLARAAEVLRCRVTTRGKFSQYFAAEDVARIRSCQLDFILRFGFNIIRGDVLAAARYGIWSFHHDDEEKYRGAPFGFWEIYHRDDRSGAMLQRLTDRLDGGIVLRKKIFETRNHSYSANAEALLSGSTSWPAEVCLDLQNGRDYYLDAAPSRSSAPIYYKPTNRQMVRFVLTLLRNQVRRRLRRDRTEAVQLPEGVYPARDAG